MCRFDPYAVGPLCCCYAVPEDIATLPDLRGYGQVYDLHQAMVRDTSGHLKSLVEQFAAEVDPVVSGFLDEKQRRAA